MLDKKRVLLALSVLSLEASAMRENGIARVLDMMAKMKANSEAEKQEEEVRFTEFSTWCSATKTELGASIEKLNEEISEAQDTNVAQTGKAKEMKDLIEKNTAEMNQKTADLEAKKAARAEDNKAFLQVKADYEVSIDAIQNAITVLKAQPATVAQGAKAALAQLKQMSMSAAKRDLISMILLNAPNAHAYENHSSGVIGMLEDLKAQFIKELNQEISDETKKAGATDKIVMSLSGQVENLKEHNKRYAGKQGKHEKAAADAQAAEELAQATLDADSKTLKETTANCNTKSEEFTARSKLRGEELVALQQAIDAINGISNKTTAAGLLQTESSFLQVSPRRNVESLKMVSQFLQNEGKKQGSRHLQLLALKTAEGGAFDKIMKMIQQMIDRLKAEALEESGKHGQCMVWMNENKSDLETSDERKASLKAEMDEQNGLIGITNQKIKDLSQSEADAQKALSDATKQRGADKKSNEKTIADAKEGEEAVDTALQILTDFYSGAAGATALVQEQSGAPATWDSAYKGNQGGGSDVMNFLEMIQADFLKLRSETETAEAADQKAYEEFVNEQDVSKATRKSTLSHTKQAHAQAKAAYAVAEKDFGKEEKVYSGLLEQKRVIEQDKGCIASSSKTPDELFKERVEAREQEIESLKNAMEMLK